LSLEQISIRQAKLADIDELVDLLHLLFSIEEDFDFDADRQRRGLAMMLEHDDAVILVAEANSRVIGMCTGQLMISTAEGGYSLLVEDVVVGKRWRGRGVGAELLKRLEELAKEMEVSRFQLLADRSNNGGLRFYQKQNWQKTELICLRKHLPTGNRSEE